MITIIAGVNGAGKSSILGETLRALKGYYVNPDEIARTLQAGDPTLSQDAINAEAWSICFDMLCAAIDSNDDFYFETTLGGDTVFETLVAAAKRGIQIRVLFMGLNSAELHIQRVAERVSRGGHPIPEAKIRERWTNSILNMVELLPHCCEVKLIDNSAPLSNGQPSPHTLIHIANGQLIQAPPPTPPLWSLPIVVAALSRVLST